MEFLCFLYVSFLFMSCFLPCLCCGLMRHRTQLRVIRSTISCSMRVPKARSGREIPIASERRSTILNILPYPITTEITQVSTSCPSLSLKFLHISYRWYQINRQSNQSNRTDQEEQWWWQAGSHGCPPKPPAFRGVQADRPISLEADPSFEELETAGATLLKSDQPHTVLDDLFLISGEIPRQTTYEDGIYGGVWFNPSTGHWEEDTWIMEERYIMCNLKSTSDYPVKNFNFWHVHAIQTKAS